jgi:hypothetical protein
MQYRHDSNGDYKMIEQALKGIIISTSTTLNMLGQSICRTIKNRLGIVGEDEIKGNVLVADIPLFHDNIKGERFTGNVF